MSKRVKLSATTTSSIINNNNNNNSLYRFALDTNQIFFQILLFIGFPALLYFSSVDRSWRARIWPRQVLTVREWKSAKTSGKKRKNKTYVHIPIPPNQTTIVASNCVFGAYCTKARFTQLPRTKFHRENVLKQLFVTYPRLESIEIVGEGGQDAEFTLDPRAVTFLIRMWKLYSSKQNQEKTLCLTDCNAEKLRLQNYDGHLGNIHLILKEQRVNALCFYNFHSVVENLRKLTIQVSGMEKYKLLYFFRINQYSSLSSLKEFSLTIETLYYSQWDILNPDTTLNLHKCGVVKLDKFSLLVKNSAEASKTHIVIEYPSQKNVEVNLKEMILSECFILENSFTDFINTHNNITLKRV